MNQANSNETAKAGFWDTVFRHKKKIVLTPLIIFSLAAAIIFLFPRTYRSEAKLLLQVGRESVGLDPSATTGQTISLQQNGRDSEIKSAIEVLQSRGVISKVVADLTPEYVLRGGPAGEAVEATFMDKVISTVTQPLIAGVKMLKEIDHIEKDEEAIIELEDNLVVDAERDSAVIVVTYDTDSAEGAQAVLQKLVETYQEEHLRIHRNKDSQSFFTDQRDLLKKQLDVAQQKVRAAKNRMGLASIEGRRATLESQLKDIETGSYQTEQQLATSLARMTDLTKQVGALPERLLTSKTKLPNEGADLLRDQLYALQMRQMDLKARYNDDHPLILAISNQVEAAEKVMGDQDDVREETVDDVNPIHRQLSLELKQQTNSVAGYNARLETLLEQKQLLLSDLKQLNRNEVELDRLERDVSIASSKFFKYSENLEQARIDQALEDQKISSVSVAQEATFSRKPVSPSKVLVGLASIFLAFCGTLSWVIGKEQLDDRLRHPTDVEETLGVPVFATVPDSKVHGRVLCS